MNSKLKKNNHLTFNEHCYELLLKIPKGRVSTYKAIAEALNSKAYQAVGNAMNSNPNPVSVPCHRVVNTDGRLGGYAFGSDRKIELLTEEGIVILDGKVQDFKRVLFDFKE
ncbi:MGMT family protein [Thiomicrorhabdus arctica]|uniref:MGMT family protein n=1 Tax=Thiomicrorhabdus arctica TaxID=131540 RepID=UPI000377A6AC|nr:MGMT family protein [Thiomicrorhabdus arctica]